MEATRRKALRADLNNDSSIKRERERERNRQIWKEVCVAASAGGRFFGAQGRFFYEALNFFSREAKKFTWDA